jgi:hypothetical protein
VHRYEEVAGRSQQVISYTFFAEIYYWITAVTSKHYLIAAPLAASTYLGKIVHFIHIPGNA